MTTTRGGLVPPEREIVGVSGWAASTPVRVANNASGQKQLDSISSLIDAISTHLGCGGKLTTKIWNIVDRLAAQLATAPFEPTSGVWEFREPMPIVTALGGVPRFHKANLIPQTADLLAAEHNERGKHVIVIVDEAHLLAPDQLEELRLLTNADMDSHSPFACVLVGQPTLRRRIKLGTFATLDQRIALRSAMPPMTPPETGAYIAHHLNLAGGADTLFSDDATALIHQVARGLPGAVNNLAVQALIAAHATKKAIVDDTSARAAVTEITAE